MIFNLYLNRKHNNMKKFLITAAITASSALLNAQDTYTIKMSLKMEGMPAEYAAYGEQDIVTQVKGEKTKTEVSSMMFSSISYADGKSFTTLSESMGNKTGFTATKEEMDAEEKKAKDEVKPKIEYTTEKKTIAGYECTKAIITTLDKDKKENKVTVWFTEKLKASVSAAKRAARGGNLNFGDLKGVPLGIEASQSANGMELKMVMTATEVSTAAIDDSVFVPNTEGYTMSSYKDWMDKMKAMRGGK